MSVRKTIPLGMQFHRWVVISDAPPNHRGDTQYLCQCVCGRQSIVHAVSLRSGHSRSCGCLSQDVLRSRRQSHGFAPNGPRSTTYIIWKSMRQRCRNQNAEAFKNYGGRGIKVCERWEKFENFLADMGERPGNLSLDRIDNDGNYEPGNCRWATRIEQRANSRTRRVPIKDKMTGRFLPVAVVLLSIALLLQKLPVG